MEFLAGLTAGTLSDIGGWMTSVLLILTFGVFLSRGWLVPRGAHLRQLSTLEGSHAAVLEAKDQVIAAQIEQFERRLAEYEEHYDALLALKREGYDGAYAQQKDAYEARLAERGELLDEARASLGDMIEVARHYGQGLTALARTAETTERLLLAIDEALDLGIGGKNERE